MSRFCIAVSVPADSLVPKIGRPCFYWIDSSSLTFLVPEVRRCYWRAISSISVEGRLAKFGALG